MTKISDRASNVLGTAASEVIALIPERVRPRVIGAVDVCAETLGALDGLDLEEHEAAQDDLPDLSTWNALAPTVRDLMLQVRAACDRLNELFPPVTPSLPPKSEDDSSSDLNIDAAFSFGGEEEEQAPDDPFDGVLGSELDALVEGIDADPTKSIGPAIAGLTTMLSEEFLHFGKQLRSPKLVSDRWFLLGELDDFRKNCSQCIEAVLATIINSFSPEPLERLLPRYKSAAARSAALRTAIADLNEVVEAANESLKASGADVDLSALADELGDALSVFTGRPSYRLLRPTDRKQILVMQATFAGWRDGVVRPVAAQRIEGFNKFLEVLLTINRRPELIQHDLDRLQDARELLAEDGRTDRILGLLLPVYGRSKDLDACLKAARDGRGSPLDTEQLVPVLDAEAERLKALKGGGALI